MAFLYCVLAVGLFVYRSRRQQQIQIEEKTFDETEWKWPVRMAGSAANPPETKANTNLKTVKLLAFFLVLVATSLFRVQWKSHLGQARLIPVIAPLLLFGLWRARKYGPRYLGWSDRLLAVPIIMASMTLTRFYHEQHATPTNFNLAGAPSPAEAMAFNLVVNLAYVTFAGILVWNRNRWKSRS